MKKSSIFSDIIVGVMNWGDWGVKLNTRDMAQLISACTKLGLTTFDHADIYGGYTTESDFGKAFVESKISREKIQLITKCGICIPCDEKPEFKIKSYNTTDQYIKQQVDQSLKNLNTEYIDVLLIHRPSPIMDYHQIAQTFEDLKNAGKVKYFGVSNFTANQFETLQALTPLVTNQVELSLLHASVLNDGTIASCQKHGIQPSAWSPLGNGKLFGLTKEADFVLKRARLKEIADNLGLELDQLSYAFIAHHPADIAIVTGSSKIDRIKIAMESAKLKLSNDQWFEIWEAINGEEVA